MSDPQRLGFWCPHCDRPLANRRRPNCAYCGEPIPPEWVISEATQAELAQQKKIERRAFNDFDSALGRIRSSHPGWTID